MKFTISQTTVRGEIKWAVSFWRNGERIWRKFFSSKRKAGKFVSEKRKFEKEEEEDGNANPDYSERSGVLPAIKEYLDWCEGRNVRPKTLKAFSERLYGFARFVGKKNVDTVLREDVVRFCTQPQLKSPWTQKGYRSDVATFLTWCSQKGWCANDFTKIVLDSILQDEKAICFLTCEEAEMFLQAVSPTHKGRVAIQLFAGLRPYEACRVTDINLAIRRIHIGGDKSKGRKARTLNDIPTNLAKWLEMFPFKPCKYNAWHSARRRAVGSLGHDALRHSFCSYGYWALGQEKCLRFTGHNDHTVFHRHYVENSVDESEAAKFFSITPESTLGGT